MSYQFTEEELRLTIGDEIIKKADLTIEDLFETLFSSDEANVPSVIESFITKEFIKQSKNLCRLTAKNWIATNLQNGSSAFIRQFVAAADNEDELIAIFPSDLQTRLLILKDNLNGLGSILIDCKRLFNRLREKFVPSQNEDKFRNFLTQWLQSGFMPLSKWKVLNEWKQKGPTLANLKNIKWQADAEKDTNWREFQRLLKNIKTDNFVETKKLEIILDICFAASKLTVNNETVKLVGRTVYLSEWADKIQDSIKLNQATQVEIFAEDSVAFDCDLTDTIWQGKNLVIVTKVVYVWNTSKICLSGVGYAPEKRKASSATTTAFRGADGEHGKAGESSGNIAILTTKMFNSSMLTVELNGGRGQDGQDGGDGCDGRNGVGVTKEDLDKLVVKYYSLYRDSWSNFYNYSPPPNWKKQSGSSSTGDYIYRTYNDEHGRIMTYSFAADKGWTYSTYELYLHIVGSNGTSGTSGGSNGVGGDGGYNGTCVVKNPETDEEFPINLVLHGKNSGPKGENGKVGKSGKHGINGNDMALIDRSAQEASKHYEGSSDRKLPSTYIYKAEFKSRLNGYKRYEEKESACFIKFSTGNFINKSESYSSQASTVYVSTAVSSVAVAKKSIIIDSVLNEAEKVFGKQSAFLADACESTALSAVDEDVEEEEETSENVNEEVVILRQKDETDHKLLKYTPESDKKQSPVYTPDAYVSYVKSVGRYSTLNSSAQILFNLFKLEFPPPQLQSISFSSLFHQLRYRQQTKSSLAVVFLAAVQSKLKNGKTYEEIKEFNSSLADRRKQKLILSKARHELRNLSKELDEVSVQPSMKLIPGADKYFGIKEGPLSHKLMPYNDNEKKTENIKKHVKPFFTQYISNEANSQLLDAFNVFLKDIRPQYEQLLVLFSQNEGFSWTNKDTVSNYLKTLKAWLVEDAELTKKEEEENKKKSNNEEHTHEPVKYQRRQKMALESDFEVFHKAVKADIRYWSKIIKPINELISKDAEYTARFDKPPNFEKGFTSFLSSSPSSIEQAQHLIKMYFIAKHILSYNQKLYILNALMLKEQGKFQEEVDLSDNYDSYLDQSSRCPVPTSSGDCEAYMIEHGLICAPFRYLLSVNLNVKLCSYWKIGYQTLKKFETLNSKATECEALWINENTIPVGIFPDENFLTFIAAQNSMLAKYRHVLDSHKDFRKDYSRKRDVLAFAAYFPEPLQSAVIEWIENYMAITHDQTLLRLLHNRMWVDGCHLSLFELQFIFTSFASLISLHYCDVNYLSLLALSTTQSKLVDVLLYARLEYHFGRRFNSPKIFNGIQMIPNNHSKALLAVKLTEYKSPVGEDEVQKIILMLQHASNGSEQLVKIGLNEWISIAQKQKWSEIGYLLQQYGPLGYYLGVLDNKGLKEVEEEMRRLIDEATVLPEKLVALYTQWFATKEFEREEDLISEFERMVLLANDYPELEDTITKHQLITTEIEQAKLINWLTTGEIKEDCVNFSNSPSLMHDRSVDEVVERIMGIHDSPEDAIKRRESVQKVGRVLKTNDTKNLNIKWLNNFDDALFKLKRKRLRNTQKLAVLCAVESEKHVLEQVNTGEGKSFIIAAIATIRRKTGKRYVDIITSSPILAQRDAAEMAPLYGLLGLTVADNCNESLEVRKKAYTADIVYGSISNFQRDHLLHSFYKKPLKGARTQVAVIVDEVDNMLLDNGNNMLYLSHSIPGMDLLDSLLIFIQQQICSPIYTGNKTNLEHMQEQFDNVRMKKAILADIFGQFSVKDLMCIVNSSVDEAKVKNIYEKMIQGGIIDSEGYLKLHSHTQLNMIDKCLQFTDAVFVHRIKACFSVILCRERDIEIPVYLRNFAKLHLDELIENCKHALFMEANTGYVVDVDHTGKLTSFLEPLVTIIDVNTGADLATSQWSGGLHQFLQLKHGCCLSPMSLKAVFVSNVAYLKRYKHINGLSGTLGSIEESKTLIDLYNADLIKIPTNKPKVFYEHVPVIATIREEWIENIYAEVVDQINGKRSVLLICEDIKQLEYVHDGLYKCFEMDKNASKQVYECFEQITTYKREHDEFQFEQGNELENHRLIIATNLAGRGTDIKLSESLVDAGGLHVITTFMPKTVALKNKRLVVLPGTLLLYFENSRFKLLNFRCGQPGSGQIISFAEAADNIVQPSVFQLKMFRDNAEVHRLQALKSFYDYHTEIEETCLEKFRSYCDKAISSIYVSNQSSGEESLPTPSQVVYFALLDQWALWLDSETPSIKQCATEKSEELKKKIINSVDKFLAEHPFGSQLDCFEVAKNWVNAPQSLLTIGIIQMSHANGFKDAEETFNKVIAMAMNSLLKRFITKPA